MLADPYLRSGIDGMIEDARGRIDYEECGAGPTIVMVPGSRSTGAAWRPVIAASNGRFREMTTAYFAAFEGGNAEAIAAMIDFYGGAGTYASWPQRVRDYAVATTPVNILDWASAYGFALPAASLAALEIP